LLQESSAQFEEPQRRKSRSPTTASNIPANQLYHGENRAEAAPISKQKKAAQFSASSAAIPAKGKKQFTASEVFSPTPAAPSNQRGGSAATGSGDENDVTGLYDALDSLRIPGENESIFGYGQADSSDEDFSPPPRHTPATAAATKAAPSKPAVQPPQPPQPPQPSATTVAPPARPPLSMAASIFGVVEDDDSDLETPPAAPEPAPPKVAKVAPPARAAEASPIRHRAVGNDRVEGSPQQTARLQRQEQTQQLQRQAILSKEVESHLQHRTVGHVSAESIEEKLQARRAEKSATTAPVPAPLTQPTGPVHMNLPGEAPERFM
jgi:hypothetical protein